MFRNHLPISVLLLSLPLAGACVASNDVVDELAGESAADDGGGKADSATFGTFYQVHQDERRCASPMCGGWWVSRVNHDKTRCADGVQRAECYVAELDVTGLGLDDADTQTMWNALYARAAVLRGDLGSATYGSYGTLGRFAASEAWVAGTDSSPDGVWVLVEPNGVRCFAAPCEDKSEKKLNSTLRANIADLDFEPSGATEDEQGVAWAGLTAGGTIVVGDRYRIQIDGRRGKGRTVTQFYTRLGAVAN